MNHMTDQFVGRSLVGDEMRSSAKEIRERLREIANPSIAEHSRRFFKTGIGEYGEGDRFLGVRVPELRKLARKHQDLAGKSLLSLLRSKYHEERLLAVLILVRQYQRGDAEQKSEVYSLYLANIEHVNNWDLIDSSAGQIVGAHLENNGKTLIYRMAKSNNMWNRRIAIMSTFHFIKNDDYNDTLAISEILKQDSHDLIQKAVGWMLREVGNRNLQTEEGFLRKHYKDMPRTMLRYAIEKFPEKKRKAYLVGRM